MGKIQFFMSARDNKMTLNEANILWQVTIESGLEEPMGVFWSADALQRILMQLKTNIELKNDGRSDCASLLKKLYDMRTKMEREADKKRGLPSSRELDRDIKIRIVFPGKGLFSAKILNNTDVLVIDMPVKNGALPKADEWVHQTITVYVWLTNDAEYCFDTEVVAKAAFFGHPALHLKHSDNMIRIQKRHAIRAKCKIYGDLYIIKSNDDLSFDKIETKKGYRCLVEDISETGALIQIAGKGQPRVKIRVQLELDGHLVAMFGVVRTVEYNETKNRSRLHFECLHIDDAMRNHVLAYVYNVASEADIGGDMDYTGSDVYTENTATVAPAAPAAASPSQPGFDADALSNAAFDESMLPSLEDFEGYVK